MISMHLIDEPDVIYNLNADRYDGDIQGYVIMDGPQYLGHALFRVDGTQVEVLECSLTDTMVLDGAVRACIAAGENAGATVFSLNTAQENLQKWFSVFCKGETAPVSVDKIFAHCD